MMLTVEDLRVRYGPIEAVHGVSFTVAMGEVVALIGANGAGKTSTLNAISGLVRPAGGSIRLGDRELAGAPSHAIVRAGVVQVPEGREILARMSVVENLRLGASAPGRPAPPGAVAEMLGRFPLLKARQALPAGNLSGGEQQVLALARALLAQPRVLLLDEPSLGLAPRMVDNIFQILAELKQAGTTMLLVEQNAVRALRLADRAYLMELGSIRVSGPAVDLLRDDAVTRAYLGG
jgi:branched-chain amino acid transport system ATP-binding protein